MYVQSCAPKFFFAATGFFFASDGGLSRLIYPAFSLKNSRRWRLWAGLMRKILIKKSYHSKLPKNVISQPNWKLKKLFLEDHLNEWLVRLTILGIRVLYNLYYRHQNGNSNHRKAQKINDIEFQTKVLSFKNVRMIVEKSSSSRPK